MASKHLVLDSSALVALMLNEDAAPSIRRILAQTDRILMSTASRLEVCMVLHGSAGFTDDDMVRTETDLRISWVSFSEEHAIMAFEAFRKFGKGRHKAALNFGDCQAYATAKLAGLPLLFIGDDFGLTDLEAIKL